MSVHPFTAHAVSLQFNITVKSLAVFAFAGVARLVLHRASSAARHALWAVTLAALLSLPMLCVAIPHWNASILPAHNAPILVDTQSSPLWAKESPEQALGRPQIGRIGTDASPLSAASDNAEPPSPAPGPSRPSAAGWVVVVWMLGFVVTFARMLFGLIAALRLAGGCRPVTDRAVLEAAAHARRVMGVDGAVSVREGSGVVVPMTCGVFRPIVLLPQDSGCWPADRLRVALLHELAHIRRWDWVVISASRLVCAIYWFHPLVWLTTRLLRAESEVACDDLVMRSGISAPDYASHLLDIVRNLSNRRAAGPLTVAMAHRLDVADRLKTILEDTRNRNGNTRRGMVLAAALAAMVIGPLAALHLTAFAAPPSTSRALAQVRAIAGLTDMRGAGIVVTLTDSKKPTPIGWPAGAALPGLIHDSDVNMVIDQLREAGAEAIAVGDQRVIVTTAAQGSGRTLFVNGAEQTSPYSIEAVGNPAKLSAELNINGGDAFYIRKFDPNMIRIQTAPRMLIPAFLGSLADAYANTVPPPAESSGAQYHRQNQAEILECSTRVEGPGLLVTLRDSRKLAPDGYPVGMLPPNLIHGTDIMVAVNTLKAAGAEAISVDGQRLTAISPISTSGLTIYVNHKILISPYVIAAIGKPSALKAAVDAPGAFGSQLRSFDPDMIQEKKTSHLLLPAYSSGNAEHLTQSLRSASRIGAAAVTRAPIIITA